ncbi:hypothetical protein [Myxococcus sp. MxC21-1]|uniref:hypothetical protein n=1 Tax=Myxococcus sp. MxC21-1 TaxID=3041439 RepID=UPI00397753AF
MARFSAATACASGWPMSAGCIHMPVAPNTTRWASPNPMPMRDDTLKRWPSSSSCAKRDSRCWTSNAHRAARCTAPLASTSGSTSKQARMESPANW